MVKNCQNDATSTGVASTFAAWGCETCGWMMPNPRFSTSDNPSREVREAFNKHQCDKYPRKKDLKHNHHASGQRKAFAWRPSGLNVCYPQDRRHNKADLPQVSAQHNTQDRKTSR